MQDELRAQLPPRADVVVIGGGIAGVCTAYFLAKAGVQVALVEKGRIGGEQSSRNWGFVRKQGRVLQEMEIIIDALQIWRELDAELGETTGFVEGGTIYAAKDEKRLAEFESWLDIARQFQLDTHMISGAELKARIPGLEGEWTGAMTTPSDGRAEPALAAPAIARGAVRLGATVLTGCAARGLETAAGRVSAVVTELGRIETSSVVLAGGAWSSWFCANHDVRFPQLRVQSNVLRTRPVDDAVAASLTEGNFWGPDVAIRRRTDGGYTVAPAAYSDFDITPDAFRFLPDFWGAALTQGRKLRWRLFGTEARAAWRQPRRWRLDEVSPFERNRVWDPEPDPVILKHAQDALARTFPALAEAGVAETWAGMIDTTPDAVPVIGPVASVPGLFLSTGYSGHGFGIGPGAGRLTAEMVQGRARKDVLWPLRLERFGEEKGMRPEGVL